MDSGHVLQSREQVWKLSVFTGKLRCNRQRLPSVSWHLVTIRLRLTGLFWIVWKVFGTEQCPSPPPVLCWRLSHPGPDVSTGTLDHSLVATLSLVYTASSTARESGSSSLASNLLSPPLFLCLSYVLPQTSCVFVWLRLGVGEEVRAVTKAAWPSVDSEGQ